MMQKDTDNNADDYIRCKPVAVRPVRKDVPGEDASGPPVSVISGVEAVEMMPTRNLFGLCSAEECVGSTEDRKFPKPDFNLLRRNEGANDEMIIGITERCVGESRMSASAVSDNVSACLPGANKANSGPVYSATDFRPYNRR